MHNDCAAPVAGPERLVVVRFALLDQLLSALRNSNGALDSLLHQVDQMKGMFSDGDESIADAEEAGVEAVTEIHGLLPVLKAAVSSSEALAVPADEYRSLLDALTSARELIKEALTTHIYDIDDEIPEDDSYSQFLKGSERLVDLAKSRLVGGAAVGVAAS